MSVAIWKEKEGSFESWSWLNKEVWRWLCGFCGKINHLSTKLWVEDRTQYTETDGEEEEGITLGGGDTNRAEEGGQEKDVEVRTNSAQRLKENY